MIDIANEEPSMPNIKSPKKSPPESASILPPSTPPRSILKPPTKKHRIPASPHRASSDAFWSQQVINDWNDQYSPRKYPSSSSRNFDPFENDAENSRSLNDSPSKKPKGSPSKIKKQELERRKDFNAKKNELAIKFLEELDNTVAGSRVALSAASTGGIRIIWSKTLQSTAGRANWKREAVRAKGTEEAASFRHYASIELAEKVIDNEGKRLFLYVSIDNQLTA